MVSESGTVYVNVQIQDISNEETRPTLQAENVAAPVASSDCELGSGAHEGGLSKTIQVHIATTEGSWGEGAGEQSSREGRKAWLDE